LTHKLGVELIRTGTWPISSGVWTATKDCLTSAVDAVKCPAVRPAVLKLGHTDKRFDGDPALGWVQNLRLTDGGETLVGDFTGMPAALDQIMASAYPDRSVEGQYDYKCAAGHAHPFVLTAVALLGVTPPGISTLKSFRDVASMYGLAASATPVTGGTPVSVTIRASGSETVPVAASAPASTRSTAMTSAVDRPPRTGEDSLDWCLATGRIDQTVYDLMRGPGSARRVLAASPPVAPPPQPPTPKGPAYAKNPFVDEVLASSRSIYQHALAGGPPPTLFSAGDVPAETMSGMDPARLLAAPWTARHAIAAARTQADAAELLELVSGPDGTENARMFELDRHPGLRDYRMRVDAWANEGVKVEASQAQQAHEQQVMASSGAPAATLDEQVEAMLAADEQRAEERRRSQERDILEGRSIGHFRDVNRVRAAATEREIRAAQDRL
jgi:hypothetical protein